MAGTDGGSASAPVRVAVAGASGRMGREAVAAVRADPGMELVREITRKNQGEPLPAGGVDVLVDLTDPESSPGIVADCVRRGVHVVVGTSGWDQERRRELGFLLDRHPGVGVVIAPNFAVGSVLASAFAAQAAKFFESVEIIEMHHPQKKDAPSGTAVRTAELVARSRAEAGLGPVPDATVEDPLGARGAEVDGIPVHSVRLSGLVAHQEVLLGGPGEQLVIRHDSFHRSGFMPGVLACVRHVASRPGLTVGLEKVLGL